MEVDYQKLKEFLYDANKNSYAGGGKEVEAQRPGFTEIEYAKGDWLFHDSYAGHFFAPGQEIVYYQSKPIWAMAYAGGMEFDYHGDEATTHKAFVFLKKALMAMKKDTPYRGPADFIEGEWKYVSTLSGDVKDFIGNEKIYQGEKLMFEQNFIGGVLVDKE